MSICFINENQGWVGTWDTDIYYTSDGGETWECQLDFDEAVQYTGQIYDIHIFDENHGFAGGYWNNFVFSPSSSVESNIERFNTQIYPNPVKTNSKIYVNLVNDKIRNAKYTVFDLQGNLIEASPEMMIPIGHNTLDFETDGYIAGSYFLVVESKGEIIAREKFIVE